MDFSQWTLPQDVWRELVADFNGDEQEAKNFYAATVSIIEELGIATASFVICEELKIIAALLGIGTGGSGIERRCLN